MKQRRYFLALILCLGLVLVTASSQVFGASIRGSDQLAATDSFQNALEYNRSGTATSWRNPDTDHSGATVPVRTFQTADGVYCREFQQNIIIDNQQQRGYGTACRQPDGSWQIVDPRTLRRAAQQPVKVTHVHVYEPAYSYPYPYPYWYFPGYLSFSFGYVEHSGHSYVGHRHNRHWGHFREGRRHHRR